MTDNPSLFDRPQPREPLLDHKGREIPQDVCATFERLALQIAGQGWKHYSADAVLHRIRWHYQIERGDRAFKCNDHWTAPLARWFLRHHPELPDFFELRERVFDGYREDAA
jgi:hypothetical protein